MDASRALGISNKRLGRDAKDPSEIYVYYTDGIKDHYQSTLKKGMDIRSIKKVMINSIIYPTMKMAMEDCNMTWHSIAKQAKDPSNTLVTMNPDEMLGGRLLTDEELERLK